ncbi:MAG: hypothetical protein E6J90_28725 [Deltaproteobacteria bacterium]|nr:MAG: hypothetical protein E6J91_18995 [Deltaproteobacteria bacterium]TMQ13346.1 MAG: hypothetical protein E6J90_28725 [Deltaproteobacteria bacterium]
MLFYFYAFKDPTKPLVKNTKTLASQPFWRMQPAYRFGKFYFTDDPTDAATGRVKIETHRLTAELSGSPVKVGTLSDEVFTFKKAGADLRMSGVLIEETGGFIVWYAEFPTSGAAPEARYRVMYGNETQFRDSALLRASDKKLDQSSFVSDKEIGGAAEPGKVGFWITHFYTTSAGTKLQVVGKIEPGCGTLALCGSTCADLSTDIAHCGKCDRACGAGKVCHAGACRSAPSPPPCDKCVCIDGFTTNACSESAACVHICRGHEPH